MNEQDCVDEENRTGIARVSLDGRFLDVDRRVEEVTGLSAEELLKCRFHDITHEDDLARDVAQLERLLQKGHGSYSILKRYVHPDGSVVWAELNVILAQSMDGSTPHFLTLIRPAALPASTLNELHLKAFRDPLTGVPNRHALDEQLVAAEYVARRTGRPFVFAVLDLDGFKLVNDTYGHLSGDEVLRDVALRLGAAISPNDFVARLGGDEFALLLHDIECEGDLQRRIARIRKKLTRPYELSQGPVRLSASVGWSTFPTEADAIPDVLDQADRAMYRAKQRRFDAMADA